MRRRAIHAVFAALTVSCLVITGIHFLKVQQAQTSRRAMTQLTITDDAPVQPRVLLAWANKLSAAGEFERAEKAYNKLINSQRNNHIGQGAQFNLANDYLRQGMHTDTAAEQRLPMLELAKQRYRDLLAANPVHWDSRYNLERALRLAPEAATIKNNDRNQPIKRVNVVVPDFKIRDLP